MAPDAITIRYPDGAWEYAFTDNVPAVGDTVKLRGRSWMVDSVLATSEAHRLVNVSAPTEAVDV